MTIIGLSLIPTSFVLFVVKEKETMCKSQQLIAGVSPLAYWMSNLVWDVTKHVFTAGLICVVIQIFQVTEISKNDYAQFNTVVIMFFLFGFAAAGLSYLLSFCFTHSNIAMAINNLLFSVSGILMWIAGLVLNAAFVKNETKVDWFGKQVPIIEILEPIFCAFPAYNVATAMNNCFSRNLLIIQNDDLDKNSTCLDNDISG